MRYTHCVIRVLPTTMFFEEWGTKAKCMAFAKKAAKCGLKVCKVLPVLEWDKHGRKKGCAS